MNRIKTNTEQNRISIFLSSDQFVRRIFLFAADRVVKNALLIIADYTRGIIALLKELRPALLILHKPTRYIVDLITKARLEPELADTEIEIQPEFIETSGNSLTPASVIDTALSGKEAEIVGLLAKDVRTSDIANSLNVSPSTVRGVRARRHVEIIQVRSLLERIRSK